MLLEPQRAQWPRLLVFRCFPSQLSGPARRRSQIQTQGETCQPPSLDRQTGQCSQHPYFEWSL